MTPVTSYELIIQIHSKEPEGVRHWYVSFFFADGEHTIMVPESVAQELSEGFHELWKAGKLTESLMPGGRVFGLFEKEVG